MELIETCSLTSGIIFHKSVTLGGGTEHVITKVGEGGAKSHKGKLSQAYIQHSRWR